jgi:DNA-binding response OmpR family regulator
MEPIQVLLADDEEELVETLAERLAMRGIDAKWVTTAEAACEELKHRQYDVAVLDVKLPRMNGFDLQRKMAQTAPAMKFIFMTGHGAPGGFTGRNTDADLYDCLIKPVDINVLIERIKEIAGRKE